MVVLTAADDVYLLCHGGGDDAVAWVERIDPVSLETLQRSPDLPGGRSWPGGIAAHANGDLYVVFGRHAHRLSADLEPLASRELPRDRPYNSFVILDDGSLVTKDFGGARPGEPIDWLGQDTEVVVLEPRELEIVTRCVVPEPSIARLSCDGDDVYVVGTASLWRLRWNPHGRTLDVDPAFAAAYRCPGEGFGWDAVIADGSAWFLNNGVGSERFNGSLRGLGVATAPQQIVRVDLASGEISRLEVNPEPGGVVANPPAVDPSRGVVVGYDTGNGVVAAWDYRAATPRRLWTRSLNHGAHPIVLPAQGLVVLADFSLEAGRESLVLVDLVTGGEQLRIATESPVQSMLFGAVGSRSDIYFCSFLTVTRVQFGERLKPSSW
jgi:hypothetical protein